MYFYYMVAAMGPKYQKYIWWKKYLTAFQMVSSYLSKNVLNQLGLLTSRKAMSEKCISYLT